MGVLPTGSKLVRVHSREPPPNSVSRTGGGRGRLLLNGLSEERSDPGKNADEMTERQQNGTGSLANLKVPHDSEIKRSQAP